MKKDSLQIKLALFLLLLTAFWLRYRGIRFGFPLITHPDEPIIVKRALHMIKTNSLDPHFFKAPGLELNVYPSLYIYLQALLFIILLLSGKIFAFFGGLTSIELTSFYYWGRLLTIFFSVGTIYTTYCCAKSLFNERIGLISALLLVFSQLHVTNSFTITVDSPMAFWVMAAFLMSCLHFTRGSALKYYLFNALFIGFAIGTKYTAFLCVLPLLYVHFQEHSFAPKKALDPRLLITLGLILFVFLLTTPYLILDYPHFKQALTFISNHYQRGHAGAEGKYNSYAFYALSLVKQYGLIPLLLSGFGMSLIFMRDRNRAFLIILFPLTYYLFVGRYRVRFERNIVTLLPFLAILSAYALVSCREWIQQRKQTPAWLGYLPLGLLLIALLGQLQPTWAYLNQVRLTDTRIVAQRWIEQNLPKQVKIAREHYTPPLDRQRFTIDFLDYYGLIKVNLAPYDYLIASSYDYDRFFKDKKRYQAQVFRYQQIFSSYELVQEITADNLKTSGPTIKILKKPDFDHLEPTNKLK